jgi:hypothetical protein
MKSKIIVFPFSFGNISEEIMKILTTISQGTKVNTKYNNYTSQVYCWRWEVGGWRLEVGGWRSICLF